MKCTKVHETIQKSLIEIRQRFCLVDKIITEIKYVHATPFLVGGAVRDIFLKREIKDIDIEVHGITLDQLEKILKKNGVVRTVGKTFGVLRIDGLDVDWSIPRFDTAGRLPQVVFSEKMSIEDACKRRDLTMNAMMINLITGELQDPFNGLQDLSNKVMRAADPVFFVQDPLRFYRVIQFVGRFEMEPDIQLDALCATMDTTGVSQERIFDEFEKLFLKSSKPSLAFKWLDKIGRLENLLPELYATKGVMQHPAFHPEGDVFEHTMQALDGAAQFSYQTADKRLIMVFAALCHDLGKVIASRIIDGIIRSHGHDIAGVPLAEALLDRLTAKSRFKKPVLRLVRYHMTPVALVKNNAGPGAYKRLAYNLAPEVSLRTLSQLCTIDKSARNSERGKPLSVCPEPLIETFFKNAELYGVLDIPEKPVLSGADFVGEIPEGPALGKILKDAYEIQINEGIVDKNELKKRVFKN